MAAEAGLLAVIVLGTAALLLPAARNGTPGPHPTLDALFTATSAACAGGLTVVDTGAHWSGLGQVVLLVLMELGGLGVMIAATLLALIVAGRLGLSTRLMGDSATGAVDAATVRRVIRGTITLALVVEAVAAVVLSLRLWLSYGYPVGRALWFGAFHAVSAFTNAGLTIWPHDQVAGGADAWMLGPLAGAFVVGGVGYPALREVIRVRPTRRWSLHTRITLIGSAVLAGAGVVVVPLLEWTNPATLGGLSTPSRLGEGAFAGLTPRSAGFASLDYASARPATRLFTDMLMFIGGGSGSTAGGVKITTVAVLVLAVLAEVRGLRDVEVQGRRIGSGTVRQAIAVTGLALTTVVLGVFALFATTRADLDTVLFETVSAFGTAGLSTGLMRHLPGSGLVVVTVLTLVGRVGPVAVATALALRRAPHAYRNPEARPAIG
jgi:Trk-type K+ transport system membrane component